MTRLYFVRHAQPDSRWPDDRTKPLTSLGLADREKVTETLLQWPIDLFISSPYKRSLDTIADCAARLHMDIAADERLRERKAGARGHTLEQLQKRWEDFTFHEAGGESLDSVKTRNIEAVRDILRAHPDKNIVIGTHGTALSTILHYYDPGFQRADFIRIWHWMPYIIRLDFNGGDCAGKEELLFLEREYTTPYHD